MNDAFGAAPESEATPFWQAADQGALLLKRCKDTGRIFHHPREYSPFTGGPTDWVEVSGRGEIYTCSLAYRADPPYCIAYVRLDEGPIVLTNILADDLQSVTIGQRVHAVFVEGADGRRHPFFRLD